MKSRWRSQEAYVLYGNTFMLAMVPAPTDLCRYESVKKLVCVEKDVYIGESDIKIVSQAYADALNSACWNEPYEEGEYINEYYTVRREGVLLKPCKYCGVFSHDYCREDVMYSVHCSKCGASTQRYGELQLACKAWNDEMVYQKELEHESDQVELSKDESRVSELKRCLCGCIPQKVFRNKLYRILCAKCGLTTLSKHDYDDALRDWNRGVVYSGEIPSMSVRRGKVRKSPAIDNTYMQMSFCND